MAPVDKALPILLSRESAAAAGAELKGKPVVAFFNVAMVGHVNPTLGIVQELHRRGVRVHYFLPHVPDFCAAAEAAGAVVEPYVAEGAEDFQLDACGDFSVCSNAVDKYSVWPLASTLTCGDYVLRRCRELQTRLVVYDPMTPHGLLVAEKLGVPSVSLVTYPGVGSLTTLLQDEAKLAHWAELRAPMTKEVLERFGVDLDAGLSSRIQWFSKDENLVTTSESLVAPLPEQGRWADELREFFPMVPVGCTACSSAPHICSAPSAAKKEAAPQCLPSDVPVAELRAAKARGAAVVYAALGSMAVGERWADDMSSSSSGGLPEGTTGKVFCQHVWGRLMEAARLLGPEAHLLLCVGKQPDALDFMGEGFEVPGNVTLRSTVQQVQVLEEHADAFVTHAGFNSLQESLVAGVPMLALPQAIDQPANARKVAAEGWGRGFLRPMEPTAAELAEAVRELVAGEGPFRQAVAQARGALLHGEVRAAERLMRWL